ncbi:hypothetical protein KF728_10905 [Candidatus Obscuribacterales bacterium]|nr:hypothetical protein [Candidatus Obscuribacterales bacterium]MBX3150647.1 hypothetical protein [Candidatus Obscuribacterales bacterium]
MTKEVSPAAAAGDADVARASSDSGTTFGTAVDMTSRQDSSLAMNRDSNSVTADLPNLQIDMNGSGSETRSDSPPGASGPAATAPEAPTRPERASWPWPAPAPSPPSLDAAAPRFDPQSVVGQLDHQHIGHDIHSQSAPARPGLPPSPAPAPSPPSINAAGPQHVKQSFFNQLEHMPIGHDTFSKPYMPPSDGSSPEPVSGPPPSSSFGKIGFVGNAAAQGDAHKILADMPKQSVAPEAPADKHLTASPLAKSEARPPNPEAGTVLEMMKKINAASGLDQSDQASKIQIPSDLSNGSALTGDMTAASSAVELAAKLSEIAPQQTKPTAQQQEQHHHTQHRQRLFPRLFNRR